MPTDLSVLRMSQCSDVVRVGSSRRSRLINGEHCDIERFS